MTIKTKLQLATALATAAALLIGLLLYAIIASATQRGEEVNRGTEIVQQTNLLRGVALNYFATGDAREHERLYLEWLSKYESLNKTMLVNFNDPQRQILLENIRQNYTDLKEVFLQCGQGNCEAKSGLEGMLAKFDVIQAVAFNLKELNQSALASDERLVKIAFFMAIALVISILVSVSYFTRTNIVEPLSTLAEEAKFISRGKFRNKFTAFKNDEIGELAKIFTYMVQQLRKLQRGLEETVKKRTLQLSLKINELENAKKTMDRLLQDLQKLNAKDKVILGSMGEGMVITDQKGKITFVNGTFEELFGLTSADVKSKYIFEYIAREDEKELIEDSHLYEGVMTGKKFNNLSGYVFCSAGKEISLGVTVSPLIMKGKNTGSIVLLHDRSREKEIEEMKKKFLAFVADRLRTPLGSMRWTLEMLMENGAVSNQPEILENLKQMHANNQRILELVNQLLDVSNIKKGDLEERIKKLDNL